MQLDHRFNAAVTRADPAWREESSSLLRGGVPFSSKQWRRGNTLLDIFHYPHGVENQAAQRIRRLAEGSSVGVRPIKGYSDEAYLIDSPSASKTRLLIRRGTTVLSIGSRDGDAVLKFASLFIGEIEQAQREGLVR